MSSPHEPARLSLRHDPAFADLESGLQEARALGPSLDQQLRMRIALGLHALPGVSSEGTAAPADGAQAIRVEVPHVATWLKVLVSGVLVLTAIGSFGALRQLRVAPDQTPQPLPLPATMKTAQTPGTKAAAPSGPAHSAEPSIERAAASVPASPRPAPPHSRRAAALHAREQSGDLPQDPSMTLTEELALLRRAKAHAVSQPERALELLDEHARRFAHGALAQEREVIAIEALLERGDRGRAEQRAAEFLRRNPGSAHVRRVRALLGDHAEHPADFDAKTGVQAHPSR